MCYDQYYGASFRVSGSTKQLALVPKAPVGDRFRTSPAGTGYNSPDNKPWSLFGDAVVGQGNCLAKIRVKDW